MNLPRHIKLKKSVQKYAAVMVIKARVPCVARIESEVTHCLEARKHSVFKSSTMDPRGEEAMDVSSSSSGSGLSEVGTFLYISLSLDKYVKSIEGSGGIAISRLYLIFVAISFHFKPAGL